MNKPRVEVSKEVLEHIDPSKPVRVYKNLNKKCLSVKQGNLVRCHVDNVVLEDCKFIVSKAGQKRVRDEKRKQVHAMVEGMVVENPSEILQLNWNSCWYNPYKTDEFTDIESGRHLKSAKYCDIDAHDGMLTLGAVFMTEPSVGVTDE